QRSNHEGSLCAEVFFRIRNEILEKLCVVERFCSHAWYTRNPGIEYESPDWLDLQPCFSRLNSGIAALCERHKHEVPGPRVCPIWARCRTTRTDQYVCTNNRSRFDSLTTTFRRRTAKMLYLINYVLSCFKALGGLPTGF